MCYVCLRTICRRETTIDSLVRRTFARGRHFLQCFSCYSNLSHFPSAGIRRILNFQYVFFWIIHIKRHSHSSPFIRYGAPLRFRRFWAVLNRRCFLNRPHPKPPVLYQGPASESVSSETYITTLIPLISGSFEAVWGGGCFVDYRCQLLPLSALITLSLSIDI